MPILRVVALGHEDYRLAALPRHPWLQPVDLRDLDLPPDLAGNDLAESRFLLSTRADTLAESADYVGLLPARWDERFPRWPRLRELSTLIPWLGRDRLLAPSAHPVAHARVDSWMRRQDEVHPGISTLLHAVRDTWAVDGDEAHPGRESTVDHRSPDGPALPEQHGVLPSPHRASHPSAHRGLPSAPQGWGVAVWGSTLILHREEFTALLAAFRAAFAAVHADHGLDLPYAYRCPRCGRTSPWGVGRWSDDRHASYFYERVTGLHFALRPGLTLVDHAGRPREPMRRQRLSRHAPDAVQRLTRLGAPARRPSQHPCDPADPRACV